MNFGKKRLRMVILIQRINLYESLIRSYKEEIEQINGYLNGNT